MHRKLNIAVWVLIILVFSTGIVSAGVLRKGARGPEVTSLQENLIQLGYDTSATGYFGPQTETALRNFQNDEGLSPDGVYGRQTAAVLEEKLAGRGDKSYIVQPGDTLTVIAINHDVSVSELRSSNNINGSTIHPGDELRIPGENGKLSGQGGVDSESVEEIHHQVRIGEALSTIARAHGIDVDTLRQANNISGDMIRAGDELVVPVSRSSEGNSRNSNNFSWPLDGRITSNYGNRRHPVTGRTNFHTGVDIAAAYGSTVKAAASGTVVHAGWRGGYGRTVIIDHGNGYKTLYAHNSQILVQQGQSVSRGSSIARVGTTGIATGPHVHFEVQQNDDHRNPLSFLP